MMNKNLFFSLLILCLTACHSPVDQVSEPNLDPSSLVPLSGQVQMILLDGDSLEAEVMARYKSVSDFYGSPIPVRTLANANFNAIIDGRPQPDFTKSFREAYIQKLGALDARTPDGKPLPLTVTDLDNVKNNLNWLNDKINIGKDFLESKVKLVKPYIDQSASYLATSNAVISAVHEFFSYNNPDGSQPSGILNVLNGFSSFLTGTVTPGAIGLTDFIGEFAGNLGMIGSAINGIIGIIDIFSGNTTPTESEKTIDAMTQGFTYINKYLGAINSHLDAIDATLRSMKSDYIEDKYSDLQVTLKNARENMDGYFSAGVDLNDGAITTAAVLFKNTWSADLKKFFDVCLKKNDDYFSILDGMASETGYDVEKDKYLNDIKFIVTTKAMVTNYTGTYTAGIPVITDFQSLGVTSIPITISIPNPNKYQILAADQFDYISYLAQYGFKPSMVLSKTQNGIDILNDNLSKTYLAGIVDVLQLKIDNLYKNVLPADLLAIDAAVDTARTSVIQSWKDFSQSKTTVTFEYLSPSQISAKVYSTQWGPIPSLSCEAIISPDEVTKFKEVFEYSLSAYSSNTWPFTGTRIYSKKTNFILGKIEKGDVEILKGTDIEGYKSMDDQYWNLIKAALKQEYQNQTSKELIKLVGGVIALEYQLKAYLLK